MTVTLQYFTSALRISRSYLSVYSSVMVCGSSFTFPTVDHGSLRWPTLGLSPHRAVWEIATRGAADRFTASFDCHMPSGDHGSQILSPWLGDIVARLHRRADRYNNPMAESTISPNSETENLASEHICIFSQQRFLKVFALLFLGLHVVINYLFYGIIFSQTL